MILKFESYLIFTSAIFVAFEFSDFLHPYLTPGDVNRTDRTDRSNRSRSKSIEVNRSDRSNQSKSIEVIVEAIEVNQSFKKCKSSIGFDRFRSASIDFDWLRLITIVQPTHLKSANPKVDGTSLSHYSLQAFVYLPALSPV